MNNMTIGRFVRQYFPYLLPSVFIAYLVLESYQMDFRPYYVAGRLLLLGRDPYLNAVTDFPALYTSVNAEAFPYSGFIYPPFASFLFVPFAWLPYGTAKLVYSGVSLACLWSLLFWLVRLVCLEASLEASVGVSGGAIALVMGSFPVLAHFERGQFDLFVCWLTIVSFAMFQRSGKSTIPALLLAIAIGTKVFPFVALIYWAAKRQYQFVVKTLGALLFLIVAPLLYFGPLPYQHFAQMLLPRFFGPLVAGGTIDVHGQKVVKGIVQAIEGNGLRITHDFVNGYMNPFLRNPVFSFSVGLVGLGLLIYFSRRQSITQQFFICLNAIHLINPNTWIMGLVWYLPLFILMFDRVSSRNKVLLSLPLFLPPSLNTSGMLAYAIALTIAIKGTRMDNNAHQNRLSDYPHR